MFSPRHLVCVWHPPRLRLPVTGRASKSSKNNFKKIKNCALGSRWLTGSILILCACACVSLCGTICVQVALVLFLAIGANSFSQVPSLHVTVCELGQLT